MSFILKVFGSVVDEPTYKYPDDKPIVIHESASEGGEPYAVTFLNVFCIPFPVIDIICTKYNIWALGQQTFVDLKAYVISAFKEDKKNIFMDTDDIEEFGNDTFNINVKVQAPQMNDFNANDSFLGIDIMGLGIIKCSDDVMNDMWHVEVVMLNEESHSSRKNILKLYYIPKVYDKIKHSRERIEYKGKHEELKPCILFLHHNDIETENLLKIFGISCPMSKTVSLVGHPDGTLLWTICDFTKEVDHGSELHTLFSVKQPIVGIRFICGSGQYVGHNFMVVGGSFGQLTLFSPVKLPSAVVVSGQHPFWVLTLHLQSSIKDFAVIQDCLLHATKDGSLVLTDFSKLMTVSDMPKASNSSDLVNVSKIKVLDKNAGVLLLQVSTGGTYLAVCCKDDDSAVHSLSLPSLLNECLNQSIKMQELFKIKAFQRKLFTAISTFASLKFDCSMNPKPLTLATSVFEVNPGKYILDVNLKDLQKFNLDSDLCSVTASVCSYFGQTHKIISKTAPYRPGQNTFSMEIIETDLQFSPISAFPLLVEVGLILQLPEIWKTNDLLRGVSNSFPFYLNIMTIMVHQPQLFENSFVPLAKTSLQTAFEAVKQLGTKRPVSNLLQIGVKTSTDYPTIFSVCLSPSYVEKVMQHSKGVDACEFILQLLLKKVFLCKADTEKFVISENSPSCLSISQTDSTVVINLTARTFESLLGLRMAVLEIIMSSHLEKCSSSSSDLAYISIPASMYRKCEELSKSVMSMFGKDVHSIEEADVIKLYSELRKELSGKLPLL